MSEVEPRSFYIGVDGGASKTHIVVCDAAGDTQGETRGGAATLNGCADTAWDTITTTLASIEGMADIDPANIHMTVGIAGTEITEARRQFIDSAPAYASLSVVSDVEIACVGAHEQADGAIVSVGTGVVGVSRVNGTLQRAGGWGFPHDDRGGGAWLGSEAVYTTLCAYDGRGNESELTRRVLGEFDDLDAMVAWINQAHAVDFARLAPIVIDSAAAGDAAADRLLRRAVAEVIQVINAVAPPEPPGGGRGLPLAVMGGLAPSLHRFFDANMRERLIEPKASAAHGGALLARARHTLEESAV